jgi:rifampicin phosphotransferase
MSQVDWTPPVPGLYGSSFRLGEWISGPVTPLFEDWALTRLEAAMHAAHRSWSGQPAPLPHHLVINGWYFYSLAWLPVTPRALLRWAPSLLWHLLRHPRRLGPILPPTMKYGIGLWEREWRDEVQPRYVAGMAQAAHGVEEADPADLPNLVDTLLDRAGEYFAWVTVVGGAAYKAEMQLVSFYYKHLAPEIGGTHLTLLVGLEPPVAAPAHAVTTLDWASPTLGERGIVALAPSVATAAGLRERREVAEGEARAALAGSRRRLRQFDELLALAQHLGPIREEQMNEFTLPWPLMRRSLVRIAEQLVGTGMLGAVSDVYYLRRTELAALLEGRPSGSLDALLAERRAAVKGAASLTPPSFVGDIPRLLTKILDMSITRMGAGGGLGAGLVGIPVSPGVATGEARVVRDADEFGDFCPGEVLVAPATTPAWTHLFADASAVVTDAGNLFSHASIAAREFGIPAIVGCAGATQRLASGQRVTVDGSRGTVTTLS